MGCDLAAVPPLAGQGRLGEGPDPATQGGPDQGRPGPRTVDGHRSTVRPVKGGRGGPGFHEAGGKYGGTFGAKRTVLIDYLGLPVAARVDSAHPHDSKTSRMLLDHSLPGLPRVGEVLADLGFEPLVKGIQRRHKVTVTTKRWRKPNKPKGFKPIRPLWKVEDCFASLAAGGASPAATKPPPSQPPPGSTSPASATCSPSCEPTEQSLRRTQRSDRAPVAGRPTGPSLRSPRRAGSIAVAGFPKLSSAFAASSLGVAEVGTGQLARIVEREPSPPLAI